MKAPCGLLGVTQFAVLKAGTAHRINNAITTSLTATGLELKAVIEQLREQIQNVE